MPDQFKGVIDLRCNNQGWSETFFFDPALNTYALCLTELKKIAYFRSAFFSKNMDINYARVSNIDSNRDGILCSLPYPLGPHSTWVDDGGTGPDSLQVCQDANSCILVRLESNAGKWGNRPINGIPDTWITNKTVPFPNYFTPAPATDPVIDPSTFAGPHLVVCQQFWRYMITSGKIAKKNPDKTITLFSIAFVTARGASTRQRGRPFGESRGRAPRNLIA